MSKKNYAFTRVKNTSGHKMSFGWLGKVGRELTAGESYDHEGVLPDELNPLEKDAFHSAIEDGEVEVTYVPAIEGDAKETKTLVKVHDSTTSTIWDNDCPARYRIVDGHAILQGGSTGSVSLTDGTGGNTIAAFNVGGASFNGAKVDATGWDDSYYEIVTGGSLQLTGDSAKALCVLTAVRID